MTGGTEVAGRTTGRGDTGRRWLLGVGLDPLTMDESVAECVKAVEEHRTVRIGMLNAAKIVRMREDVRLRRAVMSCELVLADGQAVVWAARLLREPVQERVAGIDLMMRLLPEAERRGHRVYFLGATEEVLARMMAEVRRRHPDLAIAGCRNGYFDAGDEADVVAGIRESGADLLLVGVSSPKKEYFVEKWGAATGASVVHGVGGSFDVLAGHIQRAPQWWQRNGMEWLFRALQEPRRLGPRYLATNTAFLRMVTSELRHRPPSAPLGADITSAHEAT
ncbi:N-acetylglucosaminyldiphosphoundecaprenol N-acetyl-beta-D-mannosaminyltransferase [Actinopolymorpha cephalotaxi]|uniref:N-acetylglucosaminyldiphosphoundecaprenol N-acetyl-beta-D-mannosaminyltransferase n=1 Tax=Actinopolymorpha cephalotaxi TaxID=504797 RepID=A0A1I2WNW0_9ACTN|nr:WecB/TagA/CpsF family glycosyltransferase [Actinopolymorpha cephalotaxi]NYH85051.1 N-acetylglucosaminyldiphosphoundecaprenol N-acetyl-beta-D-mannosaminyltransferase [Actinopolymorpha cephalotaxi]SFH02882.1 N-acetylglucosaminyldiphosphoundecaprenol N-acetyl-beta-D-mannosaminyltransferase [Actinopolymorpha cephalotaxi]